MRAWLSCTGAALIARDVADTVGRLASAQAARGLSATAEQEAAWHAQVEALLRNALSPEECAARLAADLEQLLQRPLDLGEQAE